MTSQNQSLQEKFKKTIFDHMTKSTLINYHKETIKKIKDSQEIKKNNFNILEEKILYLEKIVFDLDKDKYSEYYERFN